MTNARMRITLLAASLLLLVAPAAASVYRCSDIRGVPLFSQFPCATSDTVENMTITSVSVVSAAPLTKAEQATLERIQREFRRDAAEAARHRQQQRRRAARNRLERSALCARTRDALKSLRVRKRGGYGLSRARALDAEEAELRARVSERC